MDGGAGEDAAEKSTTSGSSIGRGAARFIGPSVVETEPGFRWRDLRRRRGSRSRRSPGSGDETKKGTIGKKGRLAYFVEIGRAHV